MKADGDKNDDSCVVTISDGIHRVLLPGDISIKQERRLLIVAGMSNKLRSDLLIAPHHGSKSSSSSGFLTAVNPRYVVFSAGYLNRWHMPSNEIQTRYSAFDIYPFNTAEVGMVTFKFSQNDLEDNDLEVNNVEDRSIKNKIKGNIEIISYREDIRPYWFVN
jgi:competence protein ComEC